VLCGVLLFSSVSPAFVASAAESSPIEMNAAEINKDALLEYAIELGVYFTDDEVIITDSQLLKLGWGLAYAAVALVADLVSSNTQNGYVVSIRNYGISGAYMQ
jgi:hypothetical protein